jgi:microcystin degradation protein MlrC
MRVGIIALMHESNTFIASRTDLAHFQQDLWLRGDEVRQLQQSHHEVGGFLAGLDEQQIEAVPILATRAVPHGMVTAGAFRELRNAVHDGLDRAGQLDGILVAPHGAMVSEDELDADGCWLTELRDRFGTACPIVGTLDLHGNLSPRMVAATDALIAYRTNPHLDQRQRGIDAANLIGRTIRNEVRPTQAAAFPRLVINIERQHTASEPCRSLYAGLDYQLSRPGVLSNSILLGFPYADVPELGASVIVVTDNDPTSAQSYADEVSAHLIAQRKSFVGDLIDVDSAVDRAATMPGPVCLLDMGDNVGGGSPGDGTVLAHALAARHIRSFVCLCDPSAAADARAAGFGSTIDLTVGGKTDDRHGHPLPIRGRIVGLHDGKFSEAKPRHGGMMRFDQGPTAILETDTGLTIMLTTKRVPPFSIQQLAACGVNPADYQVLVAKGVHAPVAAYAPVCRHLIRVNTPGVTCADLTQFNYDHRRKPLFPFEQ